MMRATEDNEWFFWTAHRSHMFLQNIISLIFDFRNVDHIKNLLNQKWTKITLKLHFIK